MKHLLITTIAAVLLATTAFADPIHDIAWKGDLAGVQAELDKGVDANAKESIQDLLSYADLHLCPIPLGHTQGRLFWQHRESDQRRRL